MTPRHPTTAPNIRFSATQGEGRRSRFGRSRCYAPVILTEPLGQPFNDARPLRGQCPIMSRVD